MGYNRPKKENEEVLDYNSLNGYSFCRVSKHRSGTTNDKNHKNCQTNSFLLYGDNRDKSGWLWSI